MRPAAPTTGQENLRPAGDVDDPGFALRRRTAQVPNAADPQDPPYAKKIAHKAIWVEPELLTEIEYRAKSAEGKVRYPFSKGLREIYNWGHPKPHLPRSMGAFLHLALARIVAVRVDRRGPVRLTSLPRSPFCLAGSSGTQLARRCYQLPTLDVLGLRFGPRARTVDDGTSSGCVDNKTHRLQLSR
jgi:hypothetical protein